MRSVERHAYKAAFFERLEQMPYVCSSVRVGTACDLVVELLGCLCKKFPVARFRDENVHVLVFEGGAACKEILVPQS